MMHRVLFNQAGAVAVWFAAMLPMLMLVMSYVIDEAMIRFTAKRLQIAADAASVAGVMSLPDQDAVQLVAENYVKKNFPDRNGASVIKTSDIVIGTWDENGFGPGIEPFNAVQVTTRASVENANPISMLFSTFFGVKTADVKRTAIAHVADGFGTGCEGGGFFTNSDLVAGSNNEFGDGFCLYGGDSVQIRNNNDFTDGAEVVLGTGGEFIQGNGNSGLSASDSNPPPELEVDLVLPTTIESMFAGIQEGVAPDMPPYISNGPVYLDTITYKTSQSLEPNTLYIVENEVDLSQHANLSELAIISMNGPIWVQSGSVVSDMVLTSGGILDIGANTSIGSVNACFDVVYSVYLFAKGDISIGANVELRGVQIGGQGNFEIGSNIDAWDGVSVEVDGSIEVGSNVDLAGCAPGLDSDFGSVDIPGMAQGVAMVY